MSHSDRRGRPEHNFTDNFRKHVKIQKKCQRLLFRRHIERDSSFLFFIGENLNLDIWEITKTQIKPYFRFHSDILSKKNEKKNKNKKQTGFMKYTYIRKNNNNEYILQ